MTAAQPDKIWWTAEEVAIAALPDLPSTKRGLQTVINREGWQADPEFARRRKGRGGGWEYHWSLLPDRARRELLRRAADEAAAHPAPRLVTAEEFDGLPAKTKAKAQAGLASLDQIEALELSGASRAAAVRAVAEVTAKSERTLWRLLKSVEGVERSERLFALAPRHRIAERKPARVTTCSPKFYETLKGDYLRLERPSFSECYRRACRIAAAKGWDTLPERTMRRMLERQVPRVTRILARQGDAGLMRTMPAQIRDRGALRALEAVNADAHKFDVFVDCSEVDKKGNPAPRRMQLIAFQDVYSGKILSWRVDYTPNSLAVMAAFGDMVEAWGIPERCLFDNGREFANKNMTGGTPTRFRFKIRDDDPVGILPLLGIRVHWATPAHGQAKPIERAFRDMADAIARDPRFAGAYVGHKPDAKPENYGSRAIPLEDFLAVVAEGIEEHNARAGRRSMTCRGRSFDETFAESYAQAPVRRATAEQRRLWLMGQETRQLHKADGRATLKGNEYWSDWMAECAGQKVVLRFDPTDLHAGVHVYGLDGAFMGFAATRVAAGFFDHEAARTHAHTVSAFRRAQKSLLAEHRPQTAKDVGEALDAIDRPASEELDAKVVKPIFGRPRAEALVERPRHEDPHADDDASRAVAHLADLEAARARKAEALSSEDRFAKAQALEARLAGGQEIGAGEATWLERYRGTAEYRAHAAVLRDLGGNSDGSAG